MSKKKPTYDAGDEEHVNRRKSKIDLENEKVDFEMRAILETKGGRYFVWRLMSQTHMFSSTCRTTAHDTAIASGQRDIGVWAQNELLRCYPEAFTIMQTEALQREEDLNDG